MIQVDFDDFVRTHRERAVRLAWRLIGGDEAAAEDVAQDAFVRAYQGLGRFRGDARLETWFHRILLRQAHNYRRWRALRRLWSADEFADGEEDQLADPRGREPGDPALRRRIAQALERLTRPQREAFVLVHMEGFTVREAAQVMGRAEGTLKSHLQRSLQALRKDLQDLAPEPEKPEVPNHV